MLARLQQFTTFSLLGTAVGWAWLQLALGRPAWAALGATLILLGYALFLAAEFAMLAAVHGNDPAPRARPAQLLRAWWHEVLTAPRVFCWQQPFRASAEPDHLPVQAPRHATPYRGLVLVHGFVCNRGLWNPWMRRLRAAGVPFVAVNLEPVFGPLDDYLDTIAQAVQRVREATGLAPVVVGHSMGGLAARAWWQAAGDRSLAHRVITIGTPHHGTWLARFSWTPNGHQMRQGNAWLTRLAALEAARDASANTKYAGFICFYSHCDNIVFPPSSATLPGAENHHVAGSAHVHLLSQSAVFDAVLRSASNSGC